MDVEPVHIPMITLDHITKQHAPRVFHSPFIHRSLLSSEKHGWDLFVMGGKLYESQAGNHKC